MKRTSRPRNGTPIESATPERLGSTANQHAQSPHEAQRLLHELQVHQIELLQQNEELRRLRAEIEAGLARYTDLYDFAPVGYLTVACGGDIVELNLAAAALLEQERAMATGKHIAAFVCKGARTELAGLLARTFASDERQSCVLMLSGEAARTV